VPSRIGRFLAQIKSAPPGAMSQVFVDPTRVSPSLPAEGKAISADEDYFTVRVSSIHLQAGRDWFTEHLPLLSTACEFIYNGAETAVPFVVGPGLISPAGTPPPGRVALDDVRVCASHPYGGGDLKITVQLSRVSTDTKLKQLVGFAERAAAVLKGTVVLAPYMAVAELLAGALADLGREDDSTPLFGGTRSFNQDNGTLRGGHLVVAAADLSPDRVWLIDSDVRIGDGAEAALPLEVDHAVLTIEGARDRADAASLPVVAQYWPRAQEFAGRPDKSSWSTAKTWLSMLSQELYLSPDLTTRQAESMYQQFVEQAEARHKEAIRLANLGRAPATPATLQTLNNINDAVSRL
jgi:hypothetical protein